MQFLMGTGSALSASRHRAFQPQYNSVQKTQFTREPGQLVDVYQASYEQQQGTAEQLHGVEILSKILVKRHELADSKSRKQKRNCQPGRINGKKKDPAGNGLAIGGKNKNGAQDGADARSPTEREGEPQKEAAPDPGLAGLGAQVDVAIEPARHRRTKKTNQREREKVYGTESGNERSLAQQRDNSKPGENNA